MNPFRALALLVLTATSPAGGIYWTNRGAGLVERADFDGANRTTVRPNAGTNVRGIAILPATNHIYYADNGADLIYRMNLDGSDRITIFTVGPSAFPADLRLDPAAGHLYYCDQQKAHLRRINLDGSNPLTLHSSTVHQPYYVDIDPVARRIYWGDFDGVSANTGNVFRMNFDGSGLETIVIGNLETRGVCVDPAGGHLYWVNRNAGKIMRCRLADLPVSATDPSRTQTLYAQLDTPHGLTLDVPAHRLYWVDTATNNTPNTIGDRAVSRGSLDGSTPHEVLVPINSEPWDVEIDPRCASMTEWTERFFPTGSADAAMLPSADPDADGAPNFLECALVTHPLSPREFPQPFAHAITIDATVYPALTFTRRTGISHLTISPQLQTATSSWSSAGLITVSSEALPENTERITVRSPFPLGSSPTQWFRIAATLAP
ncbi:MAG: hypothetical protein RLZZ179_1926 [Verrucomicrobiota bacterium]